MASVEIRDETVVVIDAAVVAAMVADRRRWRGWWPGCEVVVVADRGSQGLSWSMTGVMVGYSEVELVEQPRGVLVRYHLAADPTVPGTTDRVRTMPDSPRAQRELDDLRRQHILAWKRTVWALTESGVAGRAGRPT